MRKLKNIISCLFANGVWAANNTLVGVHADGVITREAGGTITRNSLVKFSNGKVVVCGAKEFPIGIAQDDVISGEIVAVKLLGNANGTVVALASEAIAEGDVLYAVADGKVAKTAPAQTGTHYSVGFALGSAASNTDIEICHCYPATVVVE